VPWITLSKDSNVEKKERTWTLANGLWQQRIKYQSIKRNYQKLLGWWFSNLAEIENHLGNIKKIINTNI